MESLQLYFQNGMNKQGKNSLFIFFKKYLSIILLGVVLSVGLYLRIGGVLTNSFAFTYDVGRDMLQVQNIVVNHKIPLIGQTTGLGGLFYGPWWYYILTPVFIASNGNPQGIAFFMVLCGLLAIFLGYIVGEKISGKTLGLIFASLLCASPVMIGFSSQIWNPNIAPEFILLAILLLLILKKTKKRFFTFLGLGFLLGLLIDTEIIFGVLFSAGFLLYVLSTQRKRFLSISALGVLLGLFMVILPRIFFEIRHSFIMVSTLLHPAEDKEAFLHVSGLLSDIPQRIFAIFSQFSETVAKNNNIAGLFILLLCCVLLIIYRKNLTGATKQMLYMMGIIITVFVLGTSIFARAIWGHYLVGLPVLYLLFVAISLQLLIKKVFYVGIGVFIVYLLFLLNPLQLYKNAVMPLWEGDASVYRNQVATIDYVYKDANNRKFNYIAYSPAVHDFPYQYLFSWYGRTKYGYVPEAKTENLLYIIIEPNPGYPGRIEDWLKIRQGDGMVVKETVVKGGIKVQTRVR